jgi:hypothetical protein
VSPPSQEGDGKAMKLRRPLLNKAERFIAHGAANVARVKACFRSAGITRTWARIFRQTHSSEFAAGRIQTHYPAPHSLVVASVSVNRV